MREPTPEELIDQVKDFGSFVAFLAAMQEDFATGDSENGNEEYTYGVVPNGTGWYNGTIDAWLEACCAGAIGIDVSDMNPWAQCAWILLSGKSYE